MCYDRQGSDNSGLGDYGSGYGDYYGSGDYDRQGSD